MSRLPRRSFFAQWVPHVPESEIEPWSRIGRAGCFETAEIADRPFGSQSGRVACANTWILVGLAGVRDHCDVVGNLAKQRHVNRGRVAPQRQQRRMALCKQVDRLAPALLRNGHAWPRPMLPDLVAVGDGVEQRHGANPKAWRRFQNRQPVPAACKFRP